MDEAVRESGDVEEENEDEDKDESNDETSESTCQSLPPECRLLRW